ncbi:hypothetical protein MUP32_05715, partial [Candidatus Microgenomates bacterium]|nr:hypothetical protein [Candidatus Microgenomates bacterium]
MNDQNSQQVDQNHGSQPVQITEKPKINYWVILIITVIALIILGSLYYVLILRKQKIETKTFNSEQITSPTTTIIPSDTEKINWSGKTYISNIFKLSLKYPDTWFVSDDILSSYDTSKVVSKETFPKSPYIKCDFVDYAQVKNSHTNIEQVSVIKKDSPKITEFKGESKISGPA